MQELLLALYVFTIFSGQAPVADFHWEPSDVLAGEDVTFFDSSSPNGDYIALWVWDFGDGSQISNEQNPHHTYHSEGSYEVTLTVTNNLGDQNSITKTITVESSTSGSTQGQQPEAFFHYEPANPLVGETIRFFDDSYDPDGQILHWKWDFGNGDTSYLRNPDITYTSAGSYPVSLTVTDDDDLTNTHTETIRVKSSEEGEEVIGEKPLANFDYSIQDEDQLTVVFFDKSYDPDGRIVYRKWDYGDGSSEERYTGFHTYTTAGDYEVTLSVKDDDGNEASRVKTVEVKKIIGNPPYVTFKWEPREPVEGEAVTFLDGSYDEEGEILSREWDFGDGTVTTTTAESIEHTYRAAGIYGVSLKVEDNNGNVAVRSKNIVVTETQELMAIFDYIPSDPVEGQIVAFDASSSSGKIKDYFWNFGDFYSARGARTTHTYYDSDVYPVSLTVTDEEGNSAETSADLIVSKPFFKVDFSVQPNYPQVNDEVRFKAKPSFGFFVEKYLWDLDGDLEWDITGPEDEVTHTYSEEGTYDVTLMAIAKDGEGNTKYYSLTKPLNVGERKVVNCYPSLPPGELWANIEIGHGGCVKIESPHEYNYISFYHANPGVRVVYEFRDVDALGFPDKDKVLTSCETVSEENYWSSCVTDTVDASHGVFACFRTSEGAGAGEDPRIWVGDTEVEYYERAVDDTFSGPLPLISPVLKVCYMPPEETPEETPEESAKDTLYTSCWDGTSYNEEYGEITRTLGEYLNSLYPLNLVTECRPTFPLPGFGKDDDTTGKKLIGLEYSSYNAIYFPADRPQYANSLIQYLEDYDPAIVTITCDRDVPSAVLEAQNFLCTNYGQRAYLQLNFNYESPGGLAQILYSVLSGTVPPEIPEPEPEKPRPPIADFKYSPTSPYVGTYVEFTDLSKDPDGAEDIVEWEWDFGDGATSTERNPTHAFTTAKPYNVRLTVTDRTHKSDYVIKTINVREAPTQTTSQPPDADFTYSPDNPVNGENVQFTDSSTDPDGLSDLIKWEWDFGDGSTSTLKNPSHVFQAEGVYKVKLTVSDRSGNKDSITKEVTVTEEAPQLQSPQADFTFSPQSPPIGKTVQFTDHSTDPDGLSDLIKWEWDFGDGSTSSLKDPSHVFQAEGVYKVKLTVSDRSGNIDSITKEVTVTPQPPTPPIASFGYEPQKPFEGDEVIFDARGSKDFDGEIVSYLWHFGDGTTGDQIVMTHTYTSIGTYTIKLTVTDDSGLEDTLEKTLKVYGHGKPVAAFTFEPPEPKVRQTITFTDGSTDPDGRIVEWYWDFGDGQTSSMQHTSVSYDYPGTYTVTLTVTDDSGLKGSVSKPVTVSK